MSLVCPKCAHKFTWKEGLQVNLLLVEKNIPCPKCKTFLCVSKIIYWFFILIAIGGLAVFAYLNGAYGALCAWVFFVVLWIILKLYHGRFMKLRVYGDKLV